MDDGSGEAGESLRDALLLRTIASTSLFWRDRMLEIVKIPPPPQNTCLEIAIYVANNGE